MIEQKRGAMGDPAGRSPGEPTVEWNECAGLAARRMASCKLESLRVVADGRPIGRISRRDIDRCRHHGNWLESVLVRDLIPEVTDTCN